MQDITTVQPIKVLMLPNGLAYDESSKMWHYRFSVCFMFQKIKDADAAQIDLMFSQFPDWIQELSKSKLFSIELAPMQQGGTNSLIFQDPQFVLRNSQEIDKNLWNRLFNPADMTRKLRVKMPVEGINHVLSNHFDDIRNNHYVRQAQKENPNIADENQDEVYHHWHFTKLGYTAADSEITLNTAREMHSNTRHILKTVKDHQDGVLRYHKAATQQNKGTDPVATTHDPFDLLAMLMEKYEIRRRLGLILDFDLTLSDDQFPYFSNGSSAKARINIPGTTHRSFDLLVDNSMYTAISFLQRKGTDAGKTVAKRFIYLTAQKEYDKDQAKNGTATNIKPPSTEFGLMEMSNALITRSEILKDALGNIDRQHSVALHQAETLKAPKSDGIAGNFSHWLDAVVAGSNHGMSEGFFVYLKNLAGAAAVGVMNEQTKLCYEGHLLAGYKLGVKRFSSDEKATDILSLCAKDTSYQIGGTKIDEGVAEGCIRAGTGVGTSHAGMESISVDEKFFHWNGESLVIRSIFDALTTESEKQNSKEHSKGLDQDPTRKLLNKNIQTFDSFLAMPKLRFGMSYSFIAANVWLNGWSLPFSPAPHPKYDGKLTSSPGQMTVRDLFSDESTQTKYSTPRVRYSRSEPVGSPVFVLNEYLKPKSENANYRGKEGEGLTHLLLREETNPDVNKSRRFIFPRSISAQMAVWHGCLDKERDVHTVMKYIDGPRARALEDCAETLSGNDIVKYLPDPMANHLAITFYLDPAMRKELKVSLLNGAGQDPAGRVKVSASGHYLTITNAFERRDWPDVLSWELILKPERRNQQELLLLDVSISDRTIHCYLKKGAEVFSESHFFYINTDERVICGQGLTVKQKDGGSKLCMSGANAGMSPAELGKQKRSLYPPTPFSMSYAIVKPLVAPAYLCSSENNIANRALLGARQMLFEGDKSATWSLPFEGSNEFLRTTIFSQSPNGFQMLGQTQVRLLDFVHFEHLNGPLLDDKDLDAKADPCFEIAKTSTLIIKSRWREYNGGSGGSYSSEGYAQGTIHEHQEWAYELGRLSEQDAEVQISQSDDLMLLMPLLNKTFKRSGSEKGQTSFTGWATKLKADIDQKDTKFRKKRVSLVGGSKFSYAYAEGRTRSLEGSPTTFFIPSNSKPHKIAIHKIIPLIERQHSDDGKLKKTYTKKGNSFRIYLEGEWWQTGSEERLGICCLKAKPLKADTETQLWDYDHFCSKIGRDITSSNDPIHADTLGYLLAKDFVEFFHSSCDPQTNALENLKAKLTDEDSDNDPAPIFLSLEEIMPNLGCWIVTPKFDPDSKKWYVDVTIDERLSNQSHAAFVELGLVRFQPFGLDYNYLADPSHHIRGLFKPLQTAISNSTGGGSAKKIPEPEILPGRSLDRDFRMSEVIASDTFYLHPTRVIKIDGSILDRLQITVDVDKNSVKLANDGKNLTEFWVCQAANDDTNMLKIFPASYKRLVAKQPDSKGMIRYSIDHMPNITNKIIVKEYCCYPNQEFTWSTTDVVNDKNRRMVFSQLLSLDEYHFPYNNADDEAVKF